MPRPSAWLALLAALWPVLPLHAQAKPEKQKPQKQKEAKGQTQSSPIQVEDSETPLGRSTWKPGFDYTRLPPTNEALWAGVSKAGVELEAAIALAAEVVGGKAWVTRAALGEEGGQAAWKIELFTAGADDQPRRVDLAIASNEPRVLARTDAAELDEQDRTRWTRLAKAAVQAEAVIATCKANARGERPEPMIAEARVRTLEFVADEAPYWRCELMGIEKQIPRRYGIEVRSDKPTLRVKLLIDRFPGTPLRAKEALELPNGMFVHDFTTGDGPTVTRDSKVRVQYRLFLLDNSKLHDTWRNNLPETFLVSQAPLKGMTEGLIGMRVGGKRKIAMPYELAFGEQGNEIVPPRAMVICDVAVEELLSQ